MARLTPLCEVLGSMLPALPPPSEAVHAADAASLAASWCPRTLASSGRLGPVCGTVHPRRARGTSLQVLSPGAAAH